MRPNNEPLDRLGTAFHIVIDPKTRSRHFAAISAATKNPPPGPAPRFPGIRRRVAVAMASLMGVMSVAGVAVAAEDSLPGELLYPVKRATERIRGVFDDNLAATHRIEEIETLLDRNGDLELIEETFEAAESALAGLDDPADLTVRLEQTRERIRNRGSGQSGAGGNGGGRDPGPGNQGTTEPDPTVTTVPEPGSSQPGSTQPADDTADPGNTSPGTGSPSPTGGNQDSGPGAGSGSTGPGGGNGATGDSGGGGGSGGSNGKGRP